MSDYRDGDEAARYRARVLEEELAKREEESATQRAELERQKAELRAKDAELAELRAKVPRPAAVTDGVRVCAGCGRANAPHYKFCLGCGADLSSAVSRPQAQTFEGPPGPSLDPPSQAKTMLLSVVIAVVILALASAIVVAVAR